MKIAILGANAFDTLEFHLKDELTHQGYECEIFDLDSSILPKKVNLGLSMVSRNYVEFINKRLLHKALDYNADLIIATYRHLEPFVVREIKRTNCKIIHVNPDAITTFQNQQLFVEEYDAYFTKDQFIYQFMKNKLRLNVYQYNEAFNPRFHDPKIEGIKKHEEKTNIDILCFGNLYPYRNRMIQQLRESGLSFTLYGNRAKFFPENLESIYQKKQIVGQDKASKLAGAKIVFNNFHYAEIESVNNKFFEVNGTGAFQICDYKPILHDLLPIKPELVSFKNIEQAETLIKHYLNEPEERYLIRNKVHQHFLDNYTYHNLIKYILSIV
ncbi:CgeB family protein [Vibrio splendidus]|uniref:CgeB family protein n=1 Tax=Vibrio splendidus TaxID=29497 RepID=UPI000C848B21|nr:glycosyltransferase [Vibrio splendidus]PMP47835.1 hypothetical protein BCS86_04950 [Vibrio splendidus]